MSIYVNVLVILLLIKYALNQWPDLEDKKNQMAFLVIASIIYRAGYRGIYTQFFELQKL